MTSQSRPIARGPLLGRLVLLGGAYAPAALIVGFRAAPHPAGWVALAIGALGICVWVAFLTWLPHAQPREIELSEARPVDPEVAGYIVSYLLPVIAAPAPGPGDLFAYGVCALLILI